MVPRRGWDDEVSPDPGLREPFPPVDGRAVVGAGAARPAARSATEAVPDRLRCLSLLDGVHPARAGMVAGTDLLPVGVAGPRPGPGGAVAVRAAPNSLTGTHLMLDRGALLP